MEPESKGLKYLEIVNKSVQSRTYSFAIFTVFVVAILLLGAIKPTLGKISQINEEIKQKKIINEQLTNKTNALSSLTNEYYSQSDDMKSLSMVFPSQGNFSLLMSNIENITSEYGFVLQSINFGSPEKVPSSLKVLKPWAIRISVSGSRANLVNFLKDLEELPMFPTVTKVSYSSGARNRSGELSYSIELQIFKIDEPNFYNQ